MKNTPLRYLARIQNSNVDKVIDESEIPVRLCNYVHVFRNDRITSDMPLDRGSATDSERKKFALKVGDVIITKDSEDPREIGVPALVESSAEDIVCGYHLTILRPNKGVHGPYLYYGLCSKTAQEQFMLSARGITRFGLNQDGIGGCAIPLPSLAHQIAIARMLDTETRRIDDLITEKNNFITLLREKRIATISHTVRNATNGASGTRLASVFQEVKNLRPLDNLVLLTPSTVHGVVPQANLSSKPQQALREGYQVSEAQPGDFVISLSSHAHGIEYCGMHGGISPDYTLLRTELPDSLNRYMRYALKSDWMISQLGQFKTGTRMGLRLTWAKVRNCRIAVPSEAEAATIAHYLDRETTRIGGLIQETEHSIALLKEKRAALITAAVTGKIDVRSAA